MVWGFGEWHDGVLVYHYRVDLHHQGAPVKNPEDLPCRRMHGAQSFSPRFREALSSPRIVAVYHLNPQTEIAFVYEPWVLRQPLIRVTAQDDLVEFVVGHVPP